jgi:hypothetical protein
MANHPTPYAYDEMVELLGDLCRTFPEHFRQRLAGTAAVDCLIARDVQLEAGSGEFGDRWAMAELWAWQGDDRDRAGRQALRDGLDLIAAERKLKIVTTTTNDPPRSVVILGSDENNPSYGDHASELIAYARAMVRHGQECPA